MTVSAKPDDTAPSAQPLVQVRTPCYNRPDFLRRALGSLQAQTWENWVCDVYDDSTNDACQALVAELQDPRIRYHRNAPRRFASANIDQCFSKANPHGATYFCLLEDDNYFLPEFMEANIALLEKWGGKVVLRNQLLETKAGTEDAVVTDRGLMDAAFDEGPLSATEMRLCLLCGIGMSHGGLFWTHDCETDFEIHHPVNSTILEPARTYVLKDDVWCALEPQAIWAENGENTTRDDGNDYLARLGRISRTLKNERNLIALRRSVWRDAPAQTQARFLSQDLFRYEERLRAQGLATSWISWQKNGFLAATALPRWVIRNLVALTFFRPEAGIRALIAGEAEKTRKP